MTTGSERESSTKVKSVAPGTGSEHGSRRGYYVHWVGFLPSPTQLFQLVHGCVDARIETIFMQFCEVFPWSVDQILQTSYTLPEQAIDEFRRECSKNGITLIPVLPGPLRLSFVIDCPQFAHFRSDYSSADRRESSIFDVDSVGAGKILEDLVDDLLSLLPDTGSILLDLDSCGSGRKLESFGREQVHRLQTRFVERVSSYLTSLDIDLIIKSASGVHPGFSRMVERDMGDEREARDQERASGGYSKDFDADWVLITVRGGHPAGDDRTNLPTRGDLFDESCRRFDGCGVAIRYPTAIRCEWRVESGGSDEFLSVVPRYAEEYRRLVTLLEEGWIEVRSFKESLIFAYGGGAARFRKPLRENLERLGSYLDLSSEIAGWIVQESERFVSPTWLQRWRNSIMEPLNEEYHSVRCRFRQLFPDAQS